MATIYRKTVTRKLPEGAEIVVRGGKRVARWRDGRGKQRSAPVVDGRDGSPRIRTTAATYTAKYRDGEGVVREAATGCTSKDAAAAVLRDLISRAEKVKAGVLTADEDRAAQWLDTPAADSLADYLDHLRAKGRSAPGSWSASSTRTSASPASPSGTTGGGRSTSTPCGTASARCCRPEASPRGRPRRPCGTAAST